MMDNEQARQVLPRLLDLQVEDTAIRRLTEKRAGLPEAIQAQELRSQVQELDADVEIATQQQGGHARECDRLEGEIELIDQKIAREEQRLFSGAVSNPKELGALQAEVEMLKKKKSAMEDELLEAMEQRDTVTATLARLTAERTTVGAQAEELEATVARLTSEIDTELQRHTATRSEIVPVIPGPVLELYEKLRSEKHGVGVAALEGSVCQGCHTTLPAKEVERLRSEGGLQRCDNCRRILVIA